MICDCHIHMVLDGADWRTAIVRHAQQPDETAIRAVLSRYHSLGYTYLRDGGDRWGVGSLARALAPEYGIRYRTPLTPFHHAGHYGRFIGQAFDSPKAFHRLVTQARSDGADFIKLMISGLMDFNQYGALSEAPLPSQEITTLIHIAHNEGFSVMAHANGARCVESAAAAGVDSIEHGAYLDQAALCAMAENGVVWVPTLSAIANLLGKHRFRDDVLHQILADTTQNLRLFADMGGLIAPGSDAGAWAVPHGVGTEVPLLQQALGDTFTRTLTLGCAVIAAKF